MHRKVLFISITTAVLVGMAIVCMAVRQGPESSAMEAAVYVNVIDAVGPSFSSAGATVELVTELGTVVRWGVVGEETSSAFDTATEWGVIFRDVDLGRYLLRVTRDDSYGAPVWLETGPS